MDISSEADKTPFGSEEGSSSESCYGSSDSDYTSSDFADVHPEYGDTFFGTHSWTCHACTPEQQRRFIDVMTSINIQVLLEACTEKRKDYLYRVLGREASDEEMTCVILDRWSMGSKNLVSEIQFNDGIRWVAKISMQFLNNGGKPTSRVHDDNSTEREHNAAESDHNEWNNNEASEAFQYELLAMEFIRKHVKLPVPMPHLVFELPTSIGPTACLVMDLVPGSHGSAFFDPRIEDECSSLGQANFRFYQDRVLMSMARTQIRLAQFESSVAGRLGLYSGSGTRTPVVGDFVVEDDPDKDHEFYKAPSDLFRSIIRNKGENIDDANQSEDLASSSRQVLSVVDANLPRLHDSRSRFFLSNVDLATHNAIFSLEGRLRAIIDVDKLFFVPIEVAVQPPAGFGLHLFSSTKTPIWRMSRKREPSYIMQYAQMLYQAGRECGNPPLGEKFATQLLADRTVVAAGLFVLDYKSHIYNTEWLASPAISKLTAQTSSPIECAAEEYEEVGEVHVRDGEGLESVSMVPLSLKADRKARAGVLSKVIEWQRRLTSSPCD
ncbi:hypothetical protein MMC30_004232 [Trapelia coarctata]|nr:hypothetical protein [Trapelia coarctata]